MKRLIIIFLISAITTFLLTGCVTTGGTVTEKTVYVTIPNDLKQKCKVSKPPSKETYLITIQSDREQVMYDYARSLMLNLKECNIQLDKLDQWDKKQDKIYNAGGSDGT